MEDVVIRQISLALVSLHMVLDLAQSALVRLVSLFLAMDKEHVAVLTLLIVSWCGWVTYKPRERDLSRSSAALLLLSNILVCSCGESLLF